MNHGKGKRSSANAKASGISLRVIFTLVMFLLTAFCLAGAADAASPDRLYATGFNGSFVPPGPDGGVAPGSIPGTASLYVIDPEDGRLVSTVPLDEPGYFLAVDPAASRLYATNGYSKNLTAINLTAMSVAAKVSMNSPPRGIALSPDGARIYLAMPDENTIGVLDAGTLAALSFIRLNASPYSLAISQDGAKLYAIGSLDGTVTVIDLPDGRPGATIAEGTELSEAVVARSTLFVGCVGTDSICAIGGAGNTATATIKGVIAPSYIAYDVAKNALIVTSRSDKNITKIDATGYNVTVTRAFWSSSYGRPVISSDGSRIFVSDDSGKIRVLNASSLVETGVIDVAYPVTALTYMPPQPDLPRPSPSPTSVRPSQGPVVSGGPTIDSINTGGATPTTITPTDILLVLLGIAVVLVVLSGITYLMMFRKRE